MIYATMYNSFRVTQGDLISILRNSRMYSRNADYGICMPLSGLFVDNLRTEGLEELLHGLELVNAH